MTRFADRLEKGNKLAAQLEELRVIGSKLMKRSITPIGLCMEGDNEITTIPIDDEVFLQEIWDRVVDYYGEAMEKKEKELAVLFKETYETKKKCECTTVAIDNPHRHKLLCTHINGEDE